MSTQYNRVCSYWIVKLKTWSLILFFLVLGKQNDL